MALINCPECAKQISDKATSCPSCGCPIGTASPVAGTPAPQPATAHTGGAALAKFFMWVVFPGIGIFVLLGVFGSMNPRPPRDAETSGPVISRAQDAVRRIAIEEGSVEFRNMHTGYGEKGRTMACGEMNGRNRLGGYTGWQQFVVVGAVVVSPEQGEVFNVGWKSYCVPPGE